MPNQISLTISRILNWSASAQSNKLQIGFYSTTGTYIAHKTLSAHYYQQSLIINTSFKIHYLPQHQLVHSRISTVQGGNQRLIGQIEINLALLKEKELLYIPFRQFQNVLEVKLYTMKPSASPPLQQTSVISRQQFLQERNDFIDKLTDHEAELKKRFSQKVYNLLKDIKNRGNSEGKERAKSSKSKNELEFRSRLSPQKVKGEMNKRDTKTELRVGSPGKPKPEHQLLIDSMENKAGSQGQDLEYHFQNHQKKQNPSKNYQITKEPKYPFGGLLEQDSRR